MVIYNIFIILKCLFLMSKSIRVRIVSVIYESMNVFDLTTSFIAVLINSLYCIAACTHYQMKFYFLVYK